MALVGVGKKWEGRMANTPNQLEDEVTMIDLARAQRIKDAIINHSTYERVEYITGINITTLKRIASGKRDAYAGELESIAEATQTSAVYLMFGEEKDMLKKGKLKFDGRKNKVAEAAMFCFYNIRTLQDDEIIVIAKLIAGLQAMNVSQRFFMKDLEQIAAKRKELDASRNNEQED